MAGDTGSPQCQPTDLSMNPRRKTDHMEESERIETYNYQRDMSSRKSTWKEVKVSSCLRETRDVDMRGKKEPEGVIRRKSPTTRSENINEQAIRQALCALTKSLTPTSSCIHSIRSGCIVKTPTSHIFDLSVGALASHTVNRAGTPTTMTTSVVHCVGSPLSSSPELEIVEDRPQRPNSFLIPTLSPGTNIDFAKEATAWRVPRRDRPKYLDLRHVNGEHGSPDSGLGSATPIFGMVTQESLSEGMVSPETPGTQPKMGVKRRKRKLGPGRGWKFHDLSNDGGANRKRSYAHNKLENEILQRFHDRVCVKTVSIPYAKKDKLVVVEPSDFLDCDLVRCGTALRLLFDKEAGTYKLQLLPYTLEEGPLSNQKRVLQAVSKMLAENNEVLCPSAFASLLRTGSGVIIGQLDDDVTCTTPQTPSEAAHPRKRRLPGSDSTRKSDPELQSPGYNRGQVEHQRDRLLWSLNNDLTRNNNALVGASATGRKVCLMWHTPPAVQLYGRLGKDVTQVPKWCANCIASKVNLA